MSSYLYNMSMNYCSKLKYDTHLYKYHNCYCGALVHKILSMFDITDVINVIDSDGNLGIRIPGEIDRNAITGETMPGDNKVIDLNEYNVLRPDLEVDLQLDNCVTYRVSIFDEMDALLRGD